jgi:hypothetical protein
MFDSFRWLTVDRSLLIEIGEIPDVQKRTRQKAGRTYIWNAVGI